MLGQDGPARLWSGALTAYRRRGSRAVLLDNQDVLAWVQGQILQPTNPNHELRSNPCPATATRKTARRVDRPERTPKLGSQVRFDLSADALRQRRSGELQLYVEAHDGLGGEMKGREGSA